MQYYKITMQYCCHCCSDKHLGLERSQHSRQPGCTGLHSQGCAKIGQKVIMAGGYAEGILGTTEVLNLVKRERSGGPLTTPKNYLRLATIFSGGMENVIAVGEDFQEYVYHKPLFQHGCNVGLDTSWHSFWEVERDNADNTDSVAEFPTFCFIHSFVSDHVARCCVVNITEDCRL